MLGRTFRKRFFPFQCLFDVIVVRRGHILLPDCSGSVLGVEVGDVNGV